MLLVKGSRAQAEALKEQIALLLATELKLTLSRTKTLVTHVLDAVDSPAVRCDLDPVNWLWLETVYKSGAAIDRMVDVLGADRILHAHAKDVVLETQLVTHIDERPAGQGLLDFTTFMRRMEGLGPERYLIVEHTSREEMPATKTFLDRTAEELGIRVY
ncbi:MAG: TIM barrel protein [Chloroflexota bacterium]|nr:TIM barrel protein [Chloroflexota bacterium]